MASTPDVREVPDGAGDIFPYWGMRLLGAVQINIGVLVFVLGIVDIVLTMISHDKDFQNYGSRYDVIFITTLVSSPLWCGLWFSISGGLGACLTRDLAISQHYCKIGFLVLNVLCCALFGPACAVINGFISYTRHNLVRGDYQWLISLIICFLAISEVVVATLSASVTCCCSTLRPTQVHVIVHARSSRRANSDFLTKNNSETRSCPPRINNFSNISHKHQSRNHLFHPDNNNRQATISTPVSVQGSLLEVNDDNEQQPSATPEKDVTESPPTQVQSQPPIKDVNIFRLPQEPRFQGQQLTPSSGYSALKKWALPRW